MVSERTEVEPSTSESAADERPDRHPWEVPLVVVAVLGTVVVLVAVFTALVRKTTVPTDLAATVVSLPLVFYLLRGRKFAAQRVQGVKVGETQFPEAYHILQEAAQHYGLRRTPDAFVVGGNGVINAFASGHGFRRYVVLYSDLFEVGAVAGDLDALRFVIGHEVGHIAAGHSSYWRQVTTALFGTVPIVGKTLSRAQEYTADNYAYSFHPAGVAGMTVLAVGKHLYRGVDMDAMVERGRGERGFFVWLVNAAASHPVHVKRFAALRDRSRPGQLF